MYEVIHLLRPKININAIELSNNVYYILCSTREGTHLHIQLTLSIVQRSNCSHFLRNSGVHLIIITEQAQVVEDVQQQTKKRVPPPVERNLVHNV